MTDPRIAEKIKVLMKKVKNSEDCSLLEVIEEFSYLRKSILDQSAIRVDTAKRLLAVLRPAIDNLSGETISKVRRLAKVEDYDAAEKMIKSKIRNFEALREKALFALLPLSKAGIETFGIDTIADRICDNLDYSILMVLVDIIES